MSEGAAPMMYHGSGGFGNQGPMYVVPGAVERPSRQYPLEVLQIMGGVGSGQGTPRRWQPRRDRQHTSKGNGDSAFGYDSDDSSLSSNASGSNKSGEKGEGSSRAASGHGGREWRARGVRREVRAPRRIANDRFLHTAYPVQVKYAPEDLLNGSEYDTLSQEIWDKFVKSQQTEETFRKKMNLWRYLYMTIRALFPRYGLYVVGSTMSGFGLESSDMDLCLWTRAGGAPDPRTHALQHLHHVLHFIRTLDPDAEVIQAKVPILKFQEARHGVRVDLNCNNVVGIRNTNLLQCFARMDWRVRPLVAVTKLWAQAHNINDARRRTLSSYSLTLMVVHYLQCHRHIARHKLCACGLSREYTRAMKVRVAGGVQPAVLPRAVEAGWGAGAGAAGGGARRALNRATLAELFINMLAYYAEFPYSRLAVSVRAGARVPVAECRAARAHKNDPHQWKLLCVEEPFDLTNTARSVYDPETFEKIVETFRSSHARLAAGLRLADAWPAR